MVRARIRNEQLLLATYGVDGSYVCPCGFRSPIKRQFSFHHVDPSIKTCEITRKLRALSFSIDLLESEGVIMKCENCHRVEHGNGGAKRTMWKRLQDAGVDLICCMCEGRFDPCVYDFHHLGNKRFNVSQTNWKLDNMLPELRKCVIVCARCHRAIDAGVPCPSTLTVGQQIDQRRVVCHQRKVRNADEPASRLTHPQLFDRPLGDFMLQKEPYSTELKEFIERRDWTQRVGNTPRWCFTARIDGVLAGVIMIGQPPGHTTLFKNDADYHDAQAVIQRGASASFGHRNLGSKLIMWSIRWMVRNTEKRTFVGYADPEAGERGRIYAACNFRHIIGDFGAKICLQHPDVNDGQPFSPSYLYHWRRIKEHLMHLRLWKTEYSVGGVPKSLMERCHRHNKRIMHQATRVRTSSKRKWVLVAAPNKRELKRLQSELLALRQDTVP
jgi:hypothetical protein